MRYLSKPKPMDLRQIVRIGASANYYQIEDGSVVKFVRSEPLAVGDWLMFIDREVVAALTAEDFAREVLVLGDDIDPEAIESQVETLEFVDGDPQTLCSLTMGDGRKFAGSVVSLMANQEQRRDLAYRSALVNCFNDEVLFLQRLHYFYEESQ